MTVGLMADDLAAACAGDVYEEIVAVLAFMRNESFDHVRDLDFAVLRDVDLKLVSCRKTSHQWALRLRGKDEDAWLSVRHGQEADVSSLVHELDLVRTLVRGSARRTRHVLLQDLVQSLDRLGQAAAELKRLIDAVSSANPVDPAARVAARPADSARRLVDLAVSLLPSRDRRRYAEEFHSELYDLAAAHAGLWKQLWYAINLLDRAFELRAELRMALARRVRS